MKLHEIGDLLRKKWYVLVLLPLVFGSAAAAYLWGFLEDEYSASASLYVFASEDHADPSTSGLQDTSQASASTQHLVGEIAAIAESSRVSDAVAKSLELDNLEGLEISVSEGPSGRIIELTVTGADSQLTSDVATAAAGEVALIATELMLVDSVGVLDEPAVPESPSGPDRPLYLAACASLGLLLALIVVAVGALADARVKPDDESSEAS